MDSLRSLVVISLLVCLPGRGDTNISHVYGLKVGSFNSHALLNADIDARERDRADFQADRILHYAIREQIWKVWCGISLFKRREALRLHGLRDQINKRDACADFQHTTDRMARQYAPYVYRQFVAAA